MLTPAAATTTPLRSRLVAAFLALWTSPRTPTWFVVLTSLAFAFHKPWALHTPQLYAEDGSIFLTQQEQFDSRAFFEPYMGYLHTLPRLIAWLAAHLADPAYWPAIYNGASFALAVALFFRLASPRLALPGKPALLLCFAFVAHTGEVTINVTNLQWIAAFLLILQPLLSAPPTRLALLTDLVLTALVGLTGPFSLIFLPVFAWRWFRERCTFTLLPLLVLAGCAAVQAYFLLHQPAAPATPSEPLRLLPLFSVLGSRLLVWSFFGPAVVALFSPLALAAVAFVFLSTLTVWLFRPANLRPARLILLASFILITAACIYRTRPDTWARDDLFNGDRYFFIPRLLLFWLLILEFSATSRTVAFTARALVLSGFLVHLPSYRLPAPPNYHWAEHCDPIRRGVPADIKTLPEGWYIEYPGRPQPSTH